ncbi:MAG: hypothetical protein CMH49_08065 [Myxococcales bacterium]|nr:hypothetical protein [Myxococcales bacterium]
MKQPFLLTQIFQFLYPLIRDHGRIRVVWLLLLSLIISGLEFALAVSFASLAQVLTPSVSSQDSSVLLDRLAYLAHIIWTDLEPYHALLLTSLATLVLLLLLRAILQLLYQWQLGVFSERLGMYCRLKVFRFYQYSPSLWLSESGLAELNFNITASTTIATITAQTLHLLSNLLILSFLLLGLLFSSHLQSPLFVILLCLIASSILHSLRKVIKHNAQKLVTNELEIAQITHDALYGIETLRLSQKEPFVFDRFNRALRQLLKTKISQTLLSRLPTLSLEIFGFFSLFVCALFYTHLAAFSLTKLSNALALLAAIAWRSLPIINQSLNAYTALRINLPYLARVKSLFKLEQDFIDQRLMICSNQASTEPKRRLSSTFDFNKDIHFKNLSFRYPNRTQWALNNIDMCLHKGRKFALIGDSGAGKSTLAQLLTGLSQTDYGQILIDGQELNLQQLSHWLPQVGYVPQKSHIFDLSLQENIALRDLGTSLDIKRVQQCCQLAHIDFIHELHQGYHTLLGENGYTLSGGQIQRIALARALYHSPKLLILDEACNAIGHNTESQILKTLLLNQNLTLVLISHRIEVCEHFDEVIWLKDGAICRSGPPQEVLTEYKKYLRHEKLQISIQKELS